MKQILSAFSIVLVMVACNTAPKTADIQTDTTGLANFQAMQLQQEKDSIAQWIKDSVNKDIRVAKAAYVAQSSTRSYRKSNSNAASSNGAVTTATSESSNTATQSRVSKTAKGAIIGGVAGAAGGAIINKKNRAAGAVIGGVLGAGTGAVIGRRMDKKDGRN